MLRRSQRSDVDEFVAARSGELLDTAYLLTGVPHRAEVLLQVALTEVAATWRRSELGPEQTARRAMVRAQRPWYQRPGRRPPRGGLDDAGPAAVLDRLPVRQRAALVLRWHDGLDEEQLAAVLDCSPAAAQQLADGARARFGVPEPGPVLAELAAALRRADPEVDRLTVADRLDDVQHRVDVRRAWHRTEAVASLVVATAVAVTVVLWFPSAEPSRGVRTPDPAMVDPPPRLAGHQLGAVLRVDDVDYEYLRSEQSFPGRSLLRVAVAPERRPQAVAWMSSAGPGTVTVTVDGSRVVRTRTGTRGPGVLLSAHKMHLVTLTASHPSTTVRLGLAFYESPTT